MKLRATLFIALLCMLACTPPQSEPTSQTISLTEGTNIATALSPNGEQIVFDALGRLWIMPIGGGQATAITDPYGNARQPSWSPDGERITFQAYWEGNWHIYTVKKDGTELQQLTEGPFDHREPFWARDGSIYFAGDEKGSYDIWQVKADGEKVRISDKPRNEFAPAVSSDGSSLAYVSDNDGGLMLRDLTDGTESLVYSTNNRLFAPNFVGENIYFTEQAFAFSKLQTLNPGSGETQSLSTAEEDVFPFRVQPTEQGFIYSADGKINHLVDGEAKQIPFELTVELDRPAYTWKKRDFGPAEKLPIKGKIWPQLSPMGDQIALVMMGDIWLLDMQGKASPLSQDKYIQLYPMWSPDGKQIAYLTDQSGSFELFVIDVASKESEKICATDGAVYGIAWSPDGKQIAISSSFGPRLGRVYLADVASKEVKPLTPMLQSSIGSPSWSPDGQEIAFGVLAAYSSLYREGVNGIWRYQLNGKAKGRMEGLDHMSFGTRGKDGPFYSPDGKYMAGVSAGRLWVVPLDGAGEVNGEAIQLTEELADYPSWSADSKSLLYVATDQLKMVELASKTSRVIPVNLTRSRKVATGTKLIHAGKFFDSQSGTVLENMDILVQDNIIQSVRIHGEGERPENAERIDASDYFVMPGLIDGHAHQGSVDGEKLGRAWLSWGVTATRDPTSNPYDALNRREGQEAGALLGPRIFFTGSSIDGSRVYYAGTAATQAQDQIELELKRADALDYDMIKTYVRLPDPLQRQVVEQAHQIGIPVSSHELYPGVGYGMDGVEHILGTSRRGYSAKMSHMYLSYDDVTTLIAKSGMTFTPTTGIYGAFNVLYAKHPEDLDDQRLRTFAEPYFFNQAKQMISQVESDPVAWETKINHALRMVSDIHTKGGHVSAGTDSPIYPFGFSLHVELESYAMSEMSNTEVLQSATIRAANTLHADQWIGSLEPGKLADILFLEGNPVDNIRDTRKVHAVMLGGKMYTVEELLGKVGG